MESGQSLFDKPLKKKPKLSQAYLYIAPAVIFIFALVFLPTLRVIFLSVTDTNVRTGITSFVGLENFKTIINDSVFQKTILQTIKWTFFSALGHFTLGFLLALAMNSILINNHIRSLCRALILIPWAITTVVIALVAQLWAHPMMSPVAKILAILGYHGDYLPLGNPGSAQWALIGIQVWQFTPFFMLMILAGLQTLDPNLHDAAKVDGASYWQDVRYVVIPHVRELILTLALFDIVTLAATFDLIWITTNGGPVRSTEVFATFLYRDGFLGMHWNRAGASGVILLLLLIMVTLFITRHMKNE